MEDSTIEYACQFCGVETLNFEPPPIYCSPCGLYIKRKAVYYSVRGGDTGPYFCISCYDESHRTIAYDSFIMTKRKLEKKRNDEETEEWWIQCDKCEAWQHQICVLFNGVISKDQQVMYMCPNCQRNDPLPQNDVLSAKDLPRTILSDYLEQRLIEKLVQERLERAKQQGKIYDQVPGAEELVIRVVSSADKILNVKQRFLTIFRAEKYPTKFPYKSKAVLVFQKIEGVEVCLFCIYVQEFGSEAEFPNLRHVYLAYLDFLPYFSPEIKTVDGEDLSTFVYHEILIGYLQYCKNRGFTSCYIWACPAPENENYIFYRPREFQHKPKSDELREWYLTMLGKAATENIVVDVTNLYDQFFVSAPECNAKITAARLPYFDEDYFPSAAEDLILPRKKRSYQSGLSLDRLDDLLMQKLGEIINLMKEDYILVHLQHACSHCCTLMVSGNRWVCNHCRNFQLCDKCYEIELKREGGEKHPINQRDEHTFHPVVINDVPVDTMDKDEIIESEFFESGHAFFSLCQENYYQFNTLRRAKHSSMMIIYHLHNPTAPEYVTTCNICHLEIKKDQGWHCDVCSNYEVCNACNQKDGTNQHPHELTDQPILGNRDAQTQEARQIRVHQLRKMMHALVDASVCRSAQCDYSLCRKVKGLFQHGIQCKMRASGGCLLCQRMWYHLDHHARTCNQSECQVPCCRDLSERWGRMKDQFNSRRRAAVNAAQRFEAYRNPSSGRRC